MKTYFLGFLILLLTVGSCSKVPITGRKQVNLLPEDMMTSMSLTSYNDFLKEHKVISNGSDADMVKKVGVKISTAASQYLTSHKLSDRIKGYKWEYNLVEDSQVNAWCMPGGKVVFYTGILPITQNETGMAVVMGHEIAHAIARHGNERMSQGLAVQLGGIGLAVAMSNKPQETQNLFLQSYGIGSTLGMLKYSRTHESEADKMGLIFMAMAGYNPQEAVPFWQRMKTMSGGQAPPEFLSTHPSNETRIKDLKEYMPQALKYYKGS
ncbi:MAG: M48 family metallopeptidase [Chitinophagales bacterium]|nr:M48 family metallopeptidase [Bacteroidota bacterium]